MIRQETHRLAWRRLLAAWLRLLTAWPRPLAIAVAVLALTCPGLKVARADSPGTASVTLAPLDGKHRGVVLRAQTVDATIFEDAAGVWADTEARYRLFNPDTKPITVTVTLPGPRAFPAGLPDGIGLVVGGETLPLEMSTVTDETGGAVLWTRLSVPAGRSVDAALSYRQLLPEQDGMVIFAYMSTSASQWARAPEGVRVNIRFRNPVEPDSILAVAPPPRESETGSMTWQWEGEKELTNVGLAMMKPSWWEAFLAERAAAASPGARTSDYVALAGRYLHLAQLPLLPFQNDGFTERFYPSAVSALEAAVADPRTADSEGAAPLYTALAALYDERAEASDDGARGLYTQLAADAALRGMANGGADAELRGLAADALAKALALAESRGDSEAAREYRAQLEALASGADGVSVDDRERERAREQAQLAIQRGDFPLARRLLIGLTGPGGPPPPRISALEIEVSTEPGMRRLRIAGSDGEAPGSAEVLLVSAHAALLEQHGERVHLAEDGLHLTIPFSTPAELLQAQKSLASRLSGLPELALVRDVLQPPELSLVETAEPLRVTETYVERISLRPGAEAWVGMAASLDRAADRAEMPDQETAGLLASLLRHDADAWRQLSAASSVLYRVRLSGGSGTLREWSAPPGAERSFRATARAWREDQIRLALAGAGAGAVALAGIATGAALFFGRLARRLRDGA